MKFWLVVLLAMMTLASSLQADIVNAKAVRLVSPVYPVSAVKDGLEATVIVCFGIDQDGHPVDPVVLSSTNEMFDQAALDAIALSTFVPFSDPAGSESCWRYRFRL